MYYGIHHPVNCTSKRGRFSLFPSLILVCTSSVEAWEWVYIYTSCPGWKIPWEWISDSASWWNAWRTCRTSTKINLQNLKFPALWLSPCMQKALIFIHSVESYHNNLSFPTIWMFAVCKKKNWTVGRPPSFVPSVCPGYQARRSPWSQYLGMRPWSQYLGMSPWSQYLGMKPWSQYMGMSPWSQYMGMSPWSQSSGMRPWSQNPRRFIMCENWKPRNEASTTNNLSERTPESVEAWLFPDFPHHPVYDHLHTVSAL